MTKQTVMQKAKMFTLTKTEGRHQRAPYGIKFIGDAKARVKLMNWFATNSIPDVAEGEPFIYTKDVCWLWKANTRNDNYKGSAYSRVEVDGKNVGAHRLMYATFYGEVDEFNEVDHLCHSTLCVNPYHLEEVTGAENRRRETSRRKVVRPKAEANV